ncbi:RNA polymerase I-specific transcription initiation factor rrn5 [Pleurostoma richardsiae]|uniref:RNA polymerase I-specific transcription initiation factor rrn5 n=1 Tax=Pleurostoma richardsiae TaxID=41990 RepID=A0AA38VBA9_9PEZI|nr:RNA polymerase I-specific transcription initiation factor rrn5 [Pleurostoma richardsiae]
MASDRSLSEVDEVYHDEESEIASLDPRDVKSEKVSGAEDSGSEDEHEWQPGNDGAPSKEHHPLSTTQLDRNSHERQRTRSEDIPDLPALSQGYQAASARTTQSRRSSPLKRPADALSPRPSKRTRGSAFSRAYLDLLNEDIEDAASGYVPHADVDPLEPSSALPASQIGMTFWTSAEKELFFSALGRLGRDDAAGIARRIRTKDELEVRQYLALLHDATAARRRHGELDPLELADFPAAVELSQECCEALEDAADALADRQERYEERVEAARWGADLWLVTQDNCRGVEEEARALAGDEPQAEPASLFKVENWLRLSERVFMNSPAEEGNWWSVADGECPALRATALDDFYSLAVSITRRIVAATLYVAMSRVRSKRVEDPQLKGFVMLRDVAAAAASLGMTADKRSYWVGCPRRLGLEVYEDPPRGTRDDGREPMAYENVETALLDAAGKGEGRLAGGRRASGTFVSDRESSYPSSSDEEQLEEELSDGENRSSEESGHASDEEEEDDTSDVDADILEEADEVLLHSAVDVPQTTRGRQALIRRIKAERDQEAYADRLDARDTYVEERRMWNLLGRQPTTPLPKVEDLRADTAHRNKISVNDVYSVGRDWWEKLRYVSEWEILPPT